jgi:hypothetical protein
MAGQADLEWTKTLETCHLFAGEDDLRHADGLRVEEACGLLPFLGENLVDR